MPFYSQHIRLAILAVCTLCLSEFISAQGVPGQASRGFSKTKTLGFGSVNGNVVQEDDEGYGTPPRSGARTQQRSSTSVSGSRSVSFMKNGKKVSISENGSGINVTVNGKRVRAKTAVELQKRYPDAYRLYEEGMGKTRISAGAYAGGAAQAGGGGGAGVPGQIETSSLLNRSVSVIDDGNKISVTENKSGITVSLNGKTVRAKNVAELKKRSPDAFRLYEKHLGDLKVPANQVPDAQALLREELNQLRDENQDNPQLRNLIEQMLQQTAS